MFKNKLDISTIQQNGLLDFTTLIALSQCNINDIEKLLKYHQIKEIYTLSSSRYHKLSNRIQESDINMSMLLRLAGKAVDKMNASGRIKINQISEINLDDFEFGKQSSIKSSMIRYVTEMNVAIATTHQAQIYNFYVDEIPPLYRALLGDSNRVPHTIKMNISGKLLPDFMNAAKKLLIKALKEDRKVEDEKKELKLKNPKTGSEPENKTEVDSKEQERLLGIAKSCRDTNAYYVLKGGATGFCLVCGRQIDISRNPTGIGPKCAK